MNKLNHLAIIVDGNGRWAKSIGKIRSYGHLKGYENLKKIINYVNDNLDIKYISLFVFSTENFKMPELPAHTSAGWGLRQRR